MTHISASKFQWQHLPLRCLPTGSTTISLGPPFPPALSYTLSPKSPNSSNTPLLVLALTVLKRAPIVVAQLRAYQQSTSCMCSRWDSPRRSILLPTRASRTPLGAMLLTSSAQVCRLSKDWRLVTSQTSRAILASWQQILAIERYFSCPAVSQIWNLTTLPGGCQTVFSRKAAPRVAGGCGLNSSATKRLLMLVLPTPEGPTTTTFTAMGSLYLLTALLLFMLFSFPIRLLSIIHYLITATQLLNSPTQLLQPARRSSLGPIAVTARSRQHRQGGWL